ncbi:hypothetical protein FNV43_RR16628 [Rhamnella rubrinervis]|uniref:Uncharacterized protein n=1 Tax=Rhamnella rubrinervis TaxID=2594499 RepID=A0A8K0GZ50_9ROSA|nr:hypothetical protein FNV43_RR16628 [Rhamnella rubrinervis]
MVQKVLLNKMCFRKLLENEKISKNPIEVTQKRLLNITMNKTGDKRKDNVGQFGTLRNLEHDLWKSNKKSKEDLAKCEKWYEEELTKLKLFITFTLNNKVAKHILDLRHLVVDFSSIYGMEISTSCFTLFMIDNFNLTTILLITFLTSTNIDANVNFLVANVGVGDHTLTHDVDIGIVVSTPMANVGIDIVILVGVDILSSMIPITDSIYGGNKSPK